MNYSYPLESSTENKAEQRCEGAKGWEGVYILIYGVNRLSQPNWLCLSGNKFEPVCGNLVICLSYVCHMQWLSFRSKYRLPWNNS